MMRGVYTARALISAFIVGLLVGAFFTWSGNTGGAGGNVAKDVSVVRSGYAQETECLEPSANLDANDYVALVMGTPRSGTTLVYNGVRKLLEIHDPNTVSGYYTELAARARDFSTKPSAHPLAALRSLRAPLVVKLHLLPDIKDLAGSEPAMTLGTRVIFANYRDLRTQVLSAKHMNWNSEVRPQDLSRADFCEVRSQGRMLDESAWKRPETWVLQAKAIVACNQKITKWAEGTNLVWIRYEELPKPNEMCEQKGIDWIKAISSKIGVNVPESSPQIVCDALKRMTSVVCSSNMAVNPITHFHRGHIRSAQPPSEEEKQGMAAIWQDKECRNWLEQNGYEE